MPFEVALKMNIINSIFLYVLLSLIVYWLVNTRLELKPYKDKAFLLGIIPIALAVLEIEYYAIIVFLIYYLIIYFYETRDWKNWLKKN